MSSERKKLSLKELIKPEAPPKPPEAQLVKPEAPPKPPEAALELPAGAPMIRIILQNATIRIEKLIIQRS